MSIFQKPRNTGNQSPTSPLRPRTTSEEKTWQARIMGSPVLLVCIIVHVLVIGAGVWAFQHYQRIYRERLAAEPAPEYPVMMTKVKSKVHDPGSPDRTDSQDHPPLPMPGVDAPAPVIPPDLK